MLRRCSRKYGHIEDIPAAAGQWDVDGLRGAAKLSATLQAQFDDALLFRRIATVDTDLDVGAVDEWHWTGPDRAFRRGRRGDRCTRARRRAASSPPDPLTSDTMPGGGDRVLCNGRP